MVEVKRFIRYEFSEITKEHINGYCEIDCSIDGNNYKIYDDKGVMIEIKDCIWNRNGDAKLVISCDELIINDRYVTSVKEFCMVLMKDSGYEYDEEDGFVRLEVVDERN